MSLDLTNLYDEEVAKRALNSPVYIPTYIGCSRLGCCARKTIMMFDPKLERIKETVQEIKNSQRMFELAKVIEAGYARMFLRKGKLFSYNSWVTDVLPKGMAGQLDFLLRDWGKWYLVEFKTSHPNQMNFSDSLPKLRHIKQAKAYVYALWKLGILCDEFCVMYVSRGGRGKPMEFWFKVDIKAIIKEIEAEGKYLIGARAQYDEDGTLPGMVKRELNLQKAKELQEVKLEPNWECNGTYCEFFETACKPNKSKNKVATVQEDGTIEVMKKYQAETPAIEAFVKKEKERKEEK